MAVEQLQQQEAAESINTQAMKAEIANNMQDFEDGLDGLNNATESYPLSATIDLGDTTEKLNLNMEDPNSTIDIKETKWTRAILETKISTSSEEPLPKGLLEFWVKSWKFDHTLNPDATSREATLTLPKQATAIILYKGKEVKIKMAHTLYVPEKLKFQDISNKAIENKNSSPVATSTK